MHPGRCRGLFAASWATLNGWNVAFWTDSFFVSVSTAFAQEGKSFLAAAPANPPFDLNVDESCCVPKGTLGRILDGPGLAPGVGRWKQHVGGWLHQALI
jgi:hypothetical protein